MNRARFAIAATLFGSVMYTGAALAAQATSTTSPGSTTGTSSTTSTTSNQPLQSVLQGKKITPPIRGEATVEFTQPQTKALSGQNKVQTKITVRNAAPAPIARLKITETWYDKSGAIVAGGTGIINGLLQPGEVQTIVIETPYNKSMNSNAWNFSHANGSVKTSKVKALDDKAAASTTGKPATTTASTTGKPATTTASTTKPATTTAPKKK